MRKTLLLLLVILYSINSQSQTSLKDQTTSEKIDQYVLQLMEDYEIPGSAVAVIKGTEVLHKAYYGFANKEFSVPVDENTLFKLHSVTKPIISTEIFRLIQNGKISLDDPITAYLEIDQKFNEINIAHLLAHSSGLTEIEKKRSITEADNEKLVFESELQFKPGEYFQYAATNYWLLQKITEKVTGHKFQKYIVNQSFNGAKKEVVFSADLLALIPNRTFEYYPDASQELALFDWYLPAYAHAAGALNLTLNRLISWSQQFNQYTFIDQDTRNKMWQQYPYRNDKTRRSFGWEINKVNGLNAYGHDGGGISYLQIIPKENLTIIFLSNGYRRKYVSFYVANTLASMVDEKLDVPFISAYQQLDVAFNSMETKELNYVVRKLKNNKNLDIEDIINQLGYQRLYHYEFPRYKDAISVFTFNTLENPKKWNGFDSLGEAHETFGNIEDAIKNYEIAIKLNTTNERRNNDRLQSKLNELQKLR